VNDFITLCLLAAFIGIGLILLSRLMGGLGAIPLQFTRDLPQRAADTREWRERNPAPGGPRASDAAAHLVCASPAYLD